MFEKLRKRRLQKKYNVFVSRLIEERDAFKNAVNLSEELSLHDKAELTSFYWSSIHSHLRFESLENRYNSLNFDIGILYGSLFSLGVLLFQYVSGVI